MRHIKISFEVPPGDERDVLIALLADTGYEGFEETDNVVHAYVPEEAYDAAQVAETLSMYQVQHAAETIEPRNWNEVWEAGIQPVVVDGFCTVRAHFHSPEVDTPYCVVITPKMSFGTGHHATTQLMMMAMRHIPFSGKTVLDFGTGTGVLAILAGMLGAAKTVAIDNDEWAVENARENAERNGSVGMEIAQASLEDIEAQEYDVVLANINRHILLHHMPAMYGMLVSKGILLMSGLLTEDEAVIADAAKEAGFVIEAVEQLNGWISVKAIKQ
ncbi:50S ribosomal protein L11 methyltransferase [Nemorincola caseinilytica]|uniref:Ribosomal protein L11 methyltransferase n=1 Tax=Nemorincola caseinilytica TaxID=2054315 RepID=A0ABP8NLE7_9BACT